MLKRSPPSSLPVYSRDALASSLRAGTPHAVAFQQQVALVVREATGHLGLAELNSRLLQECQRFFPRTRSASQRPGDAPAVVASIRHMWAMHAAMRRRAPGGRMQQVFAGWVRFTRFRQASNAVRNNGRAARRQWLQERIACADRAASRHDLREVFSIIQQIAPKRKREGVQIRGTDGRLLDKHQQFHDLLQYFKTAFGRSDDFVFNQHFLDPGFSHEEVLIAIGKLKPRKAVPLTCPMAEVWQCCPDDFAAYFLDVFQASRQSRLELPSDMTDCQLALLPKPGKHTRLPQDLRPLGLQCPSSKILASIVRDRILQQTQTWLQDKPQFAYLPRRSIDEAISRVFANCSAIRNLLQEGVDSVHARRQGQGPQRCIGGALVSIDLSRAFDCVPRWALIRSLQAASVTPDLIDLVLALHEGCNYTITHANHTGHFRLEQGVRQGCCLSPLLFAIFTGWIYELLEARTDASWARQFITIFADDWLLQFLFRSVRDLARLGPNVRAAFDVLAEVGMSVNPTKSKIVLRVIGSQAKAWLKQHVRRTAKGPVVDVGLPHLPLSLPRVPSITYLGVAASLAGFEMQTCKLRLKMCMAIKHRLVRLLHSSGLSLRHKVTLYRASIRSSMLYGLHAVGLTQSVLRKLDSADARCLRALARSPSHLTHETNADLRARLRISAPGLALQQLLQSRAKRSQDAACSARFQVLLQWLQQRAQDLDSTTLSLCPVEGPASCIGVYCSECGQQFSRMKFLHQHRARKHPELVVTKPSLPPASYASHTVDGMPTCRHCQSRFRRVEALKKHLKRSCPVLHGPLYGIDVKTPDGEVPTECEGLRKGHTCRDPPSMPEHPALLDDLTFRAATQKGWKHLLRDPKWVHSLRTYCVVCGQWISMKGPGAKQHVRLSHKHLHTLAVSAASQCTALGLVALSPCRYCGLSFKDPAKHVSKCGAVFQASLAALSVAQDLCHDRHAGGPRSNASPRCTPAAGGSVAGSGHQEAAEGGGAARESSPYQVPQRSEQGAEQQRQGQLGCLEPGSLGGWRQDLHPGLRHSSLDKVHDQARAEAGGGTKSPSHRHLLDVFPRQSARRPGSCSPKDGGTVATAIRGEEGGHQPAGDLVPCNDQGGGEPTWGLPRPGGSHDQGSECGMGLAGSHGPEPRVALPAMEPRNEASGALFQGALEAPGCSSASGDADDKGGLSKHHHQIQGRAQARGRSRGGSGTLHAFFKPAKRVSSSVPCGASGSRQQCQHEVRSTSAEAGARGPICSGQGSRGELPPAELHRLAAPLASMAEADLSASRAASDATAEAPSWLTYLRFPDSCQLPAAKLANPHSVCYINATAQALQWLGQLTPHPLLCYGSALRALQLVCTSGQIYLPRCLAWTQLLRGWTHIAQQHDVGEFVRHVLMKAQPPAFAGRWEARLDNPHVVTDQGPMTMPLLLELTGGDIQNLIQKWHTQAAVHALCSPVGVVLLQLKRYVYADEGPSKLHTKLECRPGMLLRLPCFCEPQGTRSVMREFCVAFVIFHIGSRTDAGHYQAALSAPTTRCPQMQDPSMVSWTFQICNDRQLPRAATARDQELIHHNAYPEAQADVHVCRSASHRTPV